MRRSARIGRSGRLKGGFSMDAGCGSIMPETLWRASLVLAVYRNRHVAQARYLQLATIRGDGRPANRTVVFRGFLGETDAITIVTDMRTDKVRELEATPWAEALCDAGADVVMTERVGSHGDAFWRDELPLTVAWAFGR